MIHDSQHRTVNGPKKKSPPPPCGAHIPLLRYPGNDTHSHGDSSPSATIMEQNLVKMMENVTTQVAIMIPSRPSDKIPYACTRHGVPPSL